MKEEIKAEYEVFEKIRNSALNVLISSVLVDIGAYLMEYKDDEADYSKFDKMIADVKGILGQLTTKPDFKLEEVLQTDLKDYHNLVDESEISMRTLSWVQDLIKETSK